MIIDPNCLPTPTDAEREIAIDALGYRGRQYGEIPGSFRYHVEDVAQALADQRARYEAVADWCDQQAESRSHYAKVDPSYRNTIIPYEAAAERIREVARG